MASQQSEGWDTPVHAALLGLAIGDALGVPVEFSSREERRARPVADLEGYGTHNQPPGTWSDDASLALCLADALADGYSLQAIADRFIAWYRHGYWGAHGEVFDIGITTRLAIGRLIEGTPPILAGGTAESENGNGALMRILPLLFYVQGKPLEDRFRIVEEVASITHRHVRSTLGCFLYLEFAGHLQEGCTPTAALHQLRASTEVYKATLPAVPADEWNHYSRVLGTGGLALEACADDEVQSSGYVVRTLEAALWCLLTTSDYEAAVLRAVNLGSDTDTTAAVCGGLAGLAYGIEGIPLRWVEKLVRLRDILECADRLSNARFTT